MDMLEDETPLEEELLPLDLLLDLGFGASTLSVPNAFALTLGNRVPSILVSFYTTSKNRYIKITPRHVVNYSNIN